MRKPLSVIVTTLNEAENLPGCLESVRWADDVLVVDSGSDDGTVDVARRFGARVLVHAYESAGRQKNWALPQAKYEWVLIVDADERVTPELAVEIQAVLSADTACDGYQLRRRSYFLGHRIRHCGWDRERVLRFFRATCGRYDDRMVHEKLQLDGRRGELRAPLLHFTYRTFSEYLDRLDRYTARGATDLRRAGRRRSIVALVVRPPARFVRMFFWQLGFLDGIYGLLLCTLAAYSVWLKYARLFEPEPAARTESAPQREVVP